MRRLAPLILAIMMLLTSCAGEVDSVAEDFFTQTDSTCASQTTTTQTMSTVIERSEYVYAPPEQLLDAHFYSEDIEAEIELVLLEDGDTVFPPELSERFISKASQFKDVYEGCDMHISYMPYDMNDDGAEDYLAVASFWEAQPHPYLLKNVNRIYLSDGMGGYKQIEWSSYEYAASSYILSTQTNGLKDIMILHNSNMPVICYDGEENYSTLHILDERHTFLDYEVLDGGILHINMKLSVTDTAWGDHYTAVRFADNDIMKNNVLYTSQPDGSPRSYCYQPNEYQFDPSADGYDFYVEMNGSYTEQELMELKLLEIKQIPLKDESSSEILETITSHGSELSVIRRDEVQYDFLLSSDAGEELVFSVELWGDVGCIPYEENGIKALVLFQGVVGPAMPANVVTLDGSKVVVHSTFSESSEGLPELFYSPYGEMICRRGNGVSAGSANCIPYYWDSYEERFVPYPLTEITKDELRALDTENIIPDIDSAISIYRRANGLVHVNYMEIYEANMGAEDIASRTYVETENGLREYIIDEDIRYGLLLEALTVTE